MLIIQLPSRIHDAPTEELVVPFRLHEAVSFSLDDFRLSASTVRTIITDTITAVPDLVISISSSRAKILKHLLIFECAFSQPVQQLFTKVKTLAASLPDVKMVFILQIQERKEFHSPHSSSAAWKRFKSDPSLLDFQQFLQVADEEAAELQKNDPTLELPPEKFMGAVSAGGHVWCDIDCVQYYVWVRQDDGNLVINPESKEQTDWSAYGVR